MSISSSVLARLARPSLTTVLLRPSPSTHTVARSYTSQAPGQPPPVNKSSKSNNQLLLIATGTAAAAGLYWYYTHPGDAQHATDTAKRTEGEATVFKTQEIAEAGKARVRDMGTQGRKEVEAAKVRMNAFSCALCADSLAEPLIIVLGFWTGETRRCAFDGAGSGGSGTSRGCCGPGPGRRDQGEAGAEIQRNQGGGREDGA